MPTRPGVAGLVLSLMLTKPQLAVLVPVVLLAGGHRRALAGFVAGGVLLFGATTLAFGPGIWGANSQQAEWLRTTILGDGTGVWHRMVSVFVLLRHGGFSVPSAHAVQAGASLAVAVAVAVGLAWRRGGPWPARCGALVLGGLLAAPHVSL